jgi:tetratricopeptide (TPR) repeat protein/tRNA A-37 threonylcarbamoyl transferase component Bud32
MLCQHCGTDTPHPAIACQSCSTPFPRASASNTDSETISYGTGTPPAPPKKGTGPLELGAPFGTRYRILRELGAGGMGVVYQAWDAELGVAVALKVVRPEVSSDPEIAREVERRFKRELLLARQVTHKNVVRIHDLGEIDGIKYITMPYIEGRDLAGVLRERGQLPATEALRIGKQIAAGLVAAHEAGVVHRDLKPENVMIDADGQALIMDFGISRSVTTGNATVTAAGAIMGTLEYMAPEQATGAAVDHRADLYALGLILHDMLVGRRRIVSGSNALSEMMGRMQQQPPPLRTIAPDVPEPLERIVTKCLQPIADQRYATSRALLSDLEALDPDGHAARKPISRDYQWKTATATMLVLLLLAAGTAVWLAQSKRAPAGPTLAHEPLSILIADFENTANDPVFDGALEQALGIAMEGAAFVTSFNRQQAKQLAARMSAAEPGSLKEAAARLVAVSQGIKVVLTGAIAKAGAGYKISVRAINPETGQLIQERSADAGDKSDVLQSMSAVAGEMRSALGDTTPENARRQAAETFTAGSLEAMAAYAQAQELNASGRTQEALAKFEEAVRHDPQFGRAYMNMGLIYTNLKQPELAKQRYAAGLKYVDRMTERERYRTLGTYYLGVTRDYAKAIENYQTLVKLYPADNTGTSNLALAYVYTRNLPMAAEMGRRAIEIYPKSVLQRTNYATYSMYSGDFETAVREAEKSLQDNPKYEWAALTLALSRASLGQEAEARATYARLKGMSELGSSLALMGEADLELYFGNLDKARAILTDGIRRDESSKDTSNLALKLIALSELHLAAGRRADALNAAERAASVSEHEAVLVPAARIFIALGQDARARAIVGNLEGMIPPHLRSYARVIAGQLALSRGRVPEAIDELRAALKLHDSWVAHIVLAEAYTAAKATVEAHDEWDRVLKRRGEAADAFFADTSSLRYLPPVYYHLGRAQEATGSAAGARASYESFLKVRGAAEPADPLATDARQRLTKPGS